MFLNHHVSNKRTKAKMNNFSRGRVFTFRGKDLLKKGVKKRGQVTLDSFVEVLASTEGEAVYKYRQYVDYGRKIGWYK